MRVAQSLKFLAFLSKVLKQFPSFFLAASLILFTATGCPSNSPLYTVPQAPLFSSSSTLRFAGLLGSVGGGATCAILLGSHDCTCTWPLNFACIPVMVYVNSLVPSHSRAIVCACKHMQNALTQLQLCAGSDKTTHHSEAKVRCLLNCVTKAHSLQAYANELAHVICMHPYLHVYIDIYECVLFTTVLARLPSYKCCG